MRRTPKQINMELIEGEDYYINEQGFMVLTEKYLRERGFCCGYGCLNCPYDYQNVEEPRRSELLLKSGKSSDKS